MGDTRYDAPYARVRDAGAARRFVMREMSDAEIVRALAGAARARDLLLANVIATEVENRVARATSLAASCPASLLEMGPDARIYYANEAAVQLLRVHRTALLGSFLWESLPAFHTSGESVKPEELPPSRALREGVTARGEFLIARRDGTRPRVRYSAAPLVREGEVLGVAIALDPLDPDA